MEVLIDQTLINISIFFKVFILFLFQACSDFLELAQAYERKFHKLLQSEKDKRIRLEETVETLAKQHNKLEQACKVVDTGMRTKSSTATNSVESPTLGRSPSLIANELDEDDEEPDEFFDAISEHPEAFGIESPQIKVSDPYAEIDDSTSTSSDVSSVTATPSVKSAEIDKNENELVNQSSSSILRRSASENILEGSKQELGHRRAVSHDLQGNFSGNFSLVSFCCFCQGHLRYHDIVQIFEAIFRYFEPSIINFTISVA